MLRSSETYIVGIDISKDNKTMVSVSKYIGEHKQLEMINQITGKKAEEICRELLTN